MSQRPMASQRPTPPWFVHFEDAKAARERRRIGLEPATLTPMPAGLPAPGAIRRPDAADQPLWRAVVEAVFEIVRKVWR